jgi:hydrogenase maturation protein HypF
MIGGDLATKYPLRMVVGILHETVDIDEWVFSKASYFPYSDREVKLILREKERNRMPVTTSCGRVLDAVSALLGICYERTYEGEPAIKLESTATCGEDVLNLDPKIKGDIVDTTYLINEIFENRNRYPIAHLAYSAEAYIAESLAELAVDKAREIGVNNIGFSGGVAYNEHIASTIRKVVEKTELKFFVHNQVPPSDGGISLGQAIAAINIL